MPQALQAEGESSDEGDVEEVETQEIARDTMERPEWVQKRAKRSPRGGLRHEIRPNFMLTPPFLRPMSFSGFPTGMWRETSEGLSRSVSVESSRPSAGDFLEVPLQPQSAGRDPRDQKAC